MVGHGQFGLCIHHHAAGHVSGVVARVGLVFAPGLCGVQRVGAGVTGLQRQVLGVAHQRQCPGIEQQACGVEAVAGVREPRAAGAQAVELTRAHTRDKDRPHAVTGGAHGYAPVLNRGAFFEQTDVHPVGVGRPDRKVHPVRAVPAAHASTQPWRAKDHRAFVQPALPGLEERPSGGGKTRSGAGGAHAPG